MCALQMQAEAGPTMLESPESLETAIERFIHKQVQHVVAQCSDNVETTEVTASIRQSVQVPGLAAMETVRLT